MFGASAAVSVALAAAVAAASFLLPSPRIRQRWWLLAAGLAAAALLFLVARAFLQERPPRRSSPRGGPAGSVLLLVLLITASLSVMAAAVTGLVHLKLRSAASRLQRETLLTAAAWRVRLTAARLPEMLGPAGSDLTTNVVEETTPDGISLITRIADMNRRFDLNNLAAGKIGDGVRRPGEILADLLTLCGDFAPLPRVEALRDWIDDDDEGHYEADFYGKLDPPYRCANTFLRGWRELLAVHGFSRQYFAPRPAAVPAEPFQADPRKCLCILPLPRARPVPVNVNTAPEPVLAAVLGLDAAEAAARIVQARRLRSYESLEPLRILLGTRKFEAVHPYLDTRSTFFEIHTHASRQGRTADVIALVQIRDGDVRCLRWQEGP